MSNELYSDERNDLSDENEEIMDYGGAVVSENPKSFLPELKLQNWRPSKQPLQGKPSFSWSHAEKLELFPNLNKLDSDETGQPNSEDDIVKMI